MKNIKNIKVKTILLLVSVLVGISSCDDSFLDRNPVNMMYADQVFNSPEAVDAYFVSLYAALPVEDFNYWGGQFAGPYGYGTQNMSNWTWESFSSTAYSGSNHSSAWTNLYKAIRNVNAFLLEIASVDIPTERKNLYVAEARFIRAYYYFAMVKYFGGVPILLEPQVFSGNNLEELNLPRNKEEEVWDQIRDDLNFAAENLNTTSVYGRANKYVALALLSRAMLHAGSIAKFGTVQLDGLIGVPSAKANVYLQASYDASHAIIQSNRYSLFSKYADKAQNFQLLFYELQGNPEAILCKGYDYETTRRTHSQDLLALPYVIRAPQGYSNYLMPTVQMVEKFEYIDGSPGTLNIGTPGNYVYYDHPKDLFANKDPRFFGSVITTGSTFKNAVITGQRGVILDGVEYAGNNYNQYFDIPTKKIVASPGPNTVPATGNSHYTTGIFWLKKWLDPYRDASICGDWKSETDWLEIRYAEVLLNHAEAAYELGKPEQEDLNAINQIRARAGIAALTSINRDKIRHERNVELAWENKILWDLKRWRTLTTEFNIWIAEGLYMFYDINADAYIFRRTPVGGGKTYQDKHYYEQIPAAERAKNPLLINNPGY
jgi:hypothetical protein